MDEDGYEADKNDIKILEWATGRTYNLTRAVGRDRRERSRGRKTASPSYSARRLTEVEQLFEYSLPKDLSQLAPNQDITQLTKEKTCTGSHSSPPGNTSSPNATTFNRPNELVAYDLKREKPSGPLTDVNGPRDAVHRSPLRYKPAGLPPPTDGRCSPGWSSPPHFDPDKKYPALLFCGGGPQSPLTPDYSFRWNFQLMAAQGLRRGHPQPAGASGLRCQVERGGIRCLGRTSHHRPADRHRRRSARTLHRPRASGGG